MEQDPFDAFGSDDDDDDDTPTNELVVFLQRRFKQLNPHIPISSRRIVCDESWQDMIEDFQSCQEYPADAAITSDITLADKVLIKGGILLLFQQKQEEICFDHLKWKRGQDINSFVVLERWPCPIHSTSCRWLPSNHDLVAELNRVARATVVLSAKEVLERKLDENSIQKATQCIEQCGYCVIPQLLDPNECKRYGEAVLEDLHHASVLLLQQGIDLYHPLQSRCEPEVYRELSMREDLRIDLRDGPSLREIRKHNVPHTVQFDTESDGSFLTGNDDILQILRRAMNPRTSLAVGNFGRFNFNGRGPDGGFQDLRIGVLGSVVSLPGCADQALHADTPHLFEHLDYLPPHYINVFAPGCPADPFVGPTAFVHGSHRLSYTARYRQEGEDNTMLWPDLVRPMVSLGDCILFDNRVLHFGLANTSGTIERPMLYINTTMTWFVDPKNWDDRQTIF